MAQPLAASASCRRANDACSRGQGGRGKGRKQDGCFQSIAADQPEPDTGACRLYQGFLWGIFLPLAGVGVTIPGIVFAFRACGEWHEADVEAKVYPVSGGRTPELSRANGLHEGFTKNTAQRSIFGPLSDRLGGLPCHWQQRDARCASVRGSARPCPIRP